MRTYHKEVSWPEQLDMLMPTGMIDAKYSRHAENAAQTDRYGEILLPAYFTMERAWIFEAEIDGSHLKIVFRYPHDDQYDMVVAALVEFDQLYVKTVWLNAVNDTHKTLNAENYAK